MSSNTVHSHIHIYGHVIYAQRSLCKGDAQSTSKVSCPKSVYFLHLHVSTLSGENLSCADAMCHPWGSLRPAQRLKSSLHGVHSPKYPLYQPCDETRTLFLYGFCIKWGWINVSMLCATVKAHGFLVSQPQASQM